MKPYKTISQQNLRNKIEKLQVNKKSHLYNFLIEVSCGITILRTVWVHKGISFKYSSLIDCTFEVCQKLRQLGIAYTIANDAPRGGKTGTHIIILTKVKTSKN